MKLKLPRLTKYNKKKKKKSHPKVETTPTDESLYHSEDGSSSNSLDVRDDKESSSSFIGPDGRSIQKISRDADRSALAMFARVSSTIAETLTEEEFGSTRNTNILYRPSAEPRDSQIVHPVVCKRDIFVRSVTPTRKMGFKKSLYHPPSNDDETKVTKEEGNGHFSLLTALKKQNLDDHSHLKINEDVAHSYSISSSMLFRKNNQLKIETGRIAGDVSQIMRTKTNPERLHCVPEEHHNDRVAKDLGRPPRFTGVVSPSSTVSSLTMCTDFETPRNYLKPHSPKPFLSSPTPLEGIEEFGGIITSGGSESSDGDYSEI